jgi:hypothetical protein
MLAIDTAESSEKRLYIKERNVVPSETDESSKKR